MKRPFAARSPEKLVNLETYRGAPADDSRASGGSPGVRTPKFLPNVLELRIDSAVAWRQRCDDVGAKTLAQTLNRLEGALRAEFGRDPFGDEIIDAIISSIHLHFDL